jgi:hypothetical protein
MKIRYPYFRRSSADPQSFSLLFVISRNGMWLAVVWMPTDAAMAISMMLNKPQPCGLMRHIPMQLFSFREGSSKWGTEMEDLPHQFIFTSPVQARNPAISLSAIAGAGELI